MTSKRRASSQSWLRKAWHGGDSAGLEAARRGRGETAGGQMLPGRSWPTGGRLGTRKNGDSQESRPSTSDSERGNIYPKIGNACCAYTVLSACHALVTLTTAERRTVVPGLKMRKRGTVCSWSQPQGPGHLTVQLDREVLQRLGHPAALTVAPVVSQAAGAHLHCLCSSHSHPEGGRPPPS